MEVAGLLSQETLKKRNKDINNIVFCGYILQYVCSLDATFSLHSMF